MQVQNDQTHESGRDEVYDSGRAAPAYGRTPTASYGERQFHCLVWLAWELRVLGVHVQLDMMPGYEPAVIVKTARSEAKVTAVLKHGAWVLQWGRGRFQHVRFKDVNAATDVMKAVQR